MKRLGGLFAFLGLWMSPCAVQAQETRPRKIVSLVIEMGHKGGAFTLSGPNASQQLLITGKDSAGALVDLSRIASWKVTPSDIVTVDAGGLVTPRKEGSATIEAKAPNGATAVVRVTVASLVNEPLVSISREIVPILTRQGCNTGGCHGKTGGQNGFQLSLFGFEPEEDFHFLKQESRGRRILSGSPDASLLLRKASGSVAHVGGKRLPIASPEYQIVRRWIAQGLPADRTDDATVTGIEVLPRERVLARGSQQQLIVIAKLSDGSTRDVTRLAQFEVNEKPLAEVNANGLVKTKDQPGAVAVMARYQTHVAVFEALVPLGAEVGTLPAPRNVIDELAGKRWRELGMPPSAPCDDATFLRRVTLDLSGRLPTLSEVSAYLADKSADRDERLVDRLLASPDYAFVFANKWSSILRNRRVSDKDDPNITRNFHAWIKDSLHANRPFDTLVRELLTVTGTQTEHPQVAWYREVNQVSEQVEDVSQLFLGQRITCARCHHHPLEKWSQEDYWSLAAFFTRVEFKNPPAPKKAKGAKTAPPRPPMEVRHKPGRAETKHPKTGKKILPAGLGATVLAIPADEDPRARLVDWMTEPANPYFARVLANRYWKHFMGRGLVEPEDDLRVTNPATNPELLDALAKHLKDSRYDLKKLVRLICTSGVYRLSSEPNEHNKDDRQSYSRFQPRRLPAEMLLDAIDDITLIRTKFKGAAGGMRAIQLPDNQADSYFLSVFGRPDFASACECERMTDANLAQSLVLVNSKVLLEKIAKGRAAQMTRDKAPHADKIRDLYLAAFSRPPSERDLRLLLAHLEGRKGNVQAAYEDIVWAVLNTKEFLFIH